MSHKMNFYGFETGVLLDTSNEEVDFYACNNKELNYGFYNENYGFFLEKDYEKNLKYIRDDVEHGVDGTYGIISFQGSVEIGSEEYYEILNDEYLMENMDYNFFKNLSGIQYSICKKDGKMIEGFLEDEIKTWMLKKMEKDISIDELNLIPRSKYALKGSGVKTLKQLLEMPLSDIQNIRNIGKKAPHSIREELNRICYEQYLESVKKNLGDNENATYILYGYDKDNGVYEEYMKSNHLEELKIVGRTMKMLVNKDLLLRECEDGHKEPIDWLEIVKDDKEQSVCWTSYEESDLEIVNLQDIIKEAEKSRNSRDSEKDFEKDKRYNKEER